MARPGARYPVSSLAVGPSLGTLLVASGASDAAERRLSMIVVALVVLAGLIALATLWFWRATRPDPLPDRSMAMRWLERNGEQQEPR